MEEYCESSNRQVSEEGAVHTPVGSRRSFFRWVTRAAAGLIGLGLAIPLAGYVISPALRRRAQSWVEVGQARYLVGGRTGTARICDDRQGRVHRGQDPEGSLGSQTAGRSRHRVRTSVHASGVRLPLGYDGPSVQVPLPWKRLRCDRRGVGWSCSPCPGPLADKNRRRTAARHVQRVQVRTEGAN